MLKRPIRLLIYAGIALLVLLIVGRATVDFYTELLWYDALGYASVLWRRVLAGAGLRVLTGALGAVVVLVNLVRVVRHLGPVQLRRRYGNIEIAEVVPRGYVRAGILIAAALAGWWLSGISFPGGSAVASLAWWHRAPWGAVDPLFARDLSFHVFALPFYSRFLDFLLLVVVWSAMLALVGYVLVGAVRVRNSRLEVEERPRRHFAILVGSLVLLFGIRYWLGRYGLLLDGSGFGGAIGYTDVNARLPAYRALAVLSLVSAAALAWGAARRTWLPAVAALGLLILTGLGFGIAYPAIVQRIRVVPNQLAREAEYIAWNIEFTRSAFGIDSIVRQPQPIAERRTPSWSDAPGVFERLPLWDADALQASFRTIESAFAYYDFPSVHIDRYPANGAYVPVGIGVREFSVNGLSPDARTWNTLHFDARQVRGNGAVAVPTSAKAAQGDPVFWLRGVPVERSASAPASLELRYPSVFFGQTTNGYLIVSPETVPDTAAGLPLGIGMGSLARRVAFAWLLGDRNLLFTGELRSSSRLLHNRQIQFRLATLAPFLYWSPDPYPVIHEGRIVWIADGYSVSASYPVARPFPLPGLGSVRYVRNSVKAAVDAVTGAVTLYAVDANEPMVATYARAFPGLFRELSEMPAGLREHLRYPLPLLRTQADVLEQYHVQEPAAFFAGQNEWQVTAEGGPQGGTDVPSPPIYTVVPDGTEHGAFVAATAFIARERQNMTAILFVSNDPVTYGRMRMIEMPRDEQVAGPRQVRIVVEQDPTISRDLSLWRQGGSDVDIGQVRLVPLDSSIAYVMPVFLKGSSGNAVPQLQLVIASDGTSVRMAPTLSDALAALDGAAPTPVPAEVPEAPADPAAWASRALETANAAERALRDGQWAEFGRRWAELIDLLQRAAAGTR